LTNGVERRENKGVCCFFIADELEYRGVL
jgi:hypothetical protein